MKLSLFLAWVLLMPVAGATNPPTAPVTEENPRTIKRYCGVNTIYAASLILGKDLSYRDIAESFPSINLRGVSVADMEGVLKHFGFKFSTKWMTLSDIAENPDGLAIIHMPAQGNQFDGHFVVARSAGAGAVQILDAPNPPAIIPAATTTDRYIAISFGQDGGRKQPFLMIAGGGGLLAGLILLGSKLRRREPV